MTQQYQVGDTIQINHRAFPDEPTEIHNRATLNGAKGVIIGKSVIGVSQAYEIQLVNSDWPSDIFLSDGYFHALGGGWREEDWRYEVNNKATYLGYRDWLDCQIVRWEDELRHQPEPWRYPHHYQPLVAVDAPNDGPMSVEVGFPNEDPDTEDDRYLRFVFTGEGMIIYSYVGEDNEIATLGRTYEEWFDSMEQPRG